MIDIDDSYYDEKFQVNCVLKLKIGTLNVTYNSNYMLGVLSWFVGEVQLYEKNQKRME